MSTEIQNPTLTPVRPKLGIRDRIDLFKATRVGGVSESSQQRSLLQRLIAIPAAGAAIIGACADGTTETTVPPTSSTTIESTTTEAPPTTPPTTEAPTTSTTVPEPEYPFNLPPTIGLPTGEVINRETEEPILLGIDELLENEFYKGAILNGRITRVYTQIQDNFQGKSAEVGYIDVVVDTYTNGEPIILHVKLGRPEFDSIIEVRSSDAKSTTVVGIETPISELISENSILRVRADRYSQIKIAIGYEDTNDYERNICENNSDTSLNILCERILDSLETRHYSKRIIELLQRGNIDPNELSDIERTISSPYEIHTFPLLK